MIHPITRVGESEDVGAPRNVCRRCGNGDGMVSERLVDNADGVAAFLSAIGNGKRLAVMCHLLDEELSVGEIAERVRLSQSALSQHLAKLRAMGLVETRRERQMIYYSCASDEARQILIALDRLFCGRKPTAAALRQA